MSATSPPVAGFVSWSGLILLPALVPNLHVKWNVTQLQRLSKPPPVWRLAAAEEQTRIRNRFSHEPTEHMGSGAECLSRSSL